MSDGVVITFLGTGDAFGSGGRLNTCFHVRTAGMSFLIDCGATACIGMKRSGIKVADLDAIFISHYHADHFAGVAYVLLESRFTGRSRDLALAGPTGLQQHVSESMKALFPGAGTEYPYRISYHEYDSSAAIPVSAARVSAFPVEHAPATAPHALRIEVAGRVIAYSGDTEWTDALVEVARGADLFICELSAFDGPVGIHLDYQTLRQNRPRLDCRKLVLTHMGDDVLANADEVARELRATPASDGLSLRI
jgi:ribonuclease BN (tRNA processing enzyme)